MKGTETEERSIHLRDYWQICWQGKWMIIAIAFVVTVLVALATFLQTPIYRAVATVEIQPRAKSITPSADFSQLGVNSWSWAAEEKYLNTQMEIVHSREIAGRVIKDLGLESSPEFAATDSPAAALASLVDLKVLPETYVLEISIEHADPKMAQMLAGGVAHAYTEFNIESAVNNARRVIDGLYEQLAPIKKGIAEKENARIELARQSAYYVPEAQESSMDSRLAQLQRELTEVQIARGEREAIFTAIKEIENRGGTYDAMPQVANDPIIRDLKEQAYRLEQQVEELSSSYREEHPKITAAKAALVDIPRKIEEETEKIISRITTEYTIFARREQDLTQELRRTREEGLGRTTSLGEITLLDADLKEDRRIYELITSRIREIELNQETLVNNIRLIQSPSLPVSPVRPRKVLNLAAGLLLGLFLGVGTVFFLDYLDNTIKSSDDIERFLRLPLLALVPRDNRDNREAKSAIKEAYQTLRTSILFSSKGRKLKVVLFTSSGPGEGKSRTAANLAKTLAMAGDKVVLVDCDLRRPTVNLHFNMERIPGLTNYLLDEETDGSRMRYLKEVPGVENLKVLTCGPLPPNPAELFGSPRFHETLGELQEQFNWVLIDSPPLASLSDSLILGSLAHMTVLVIKYNENDREQIRRTTEQLRKVDANVVGAVLNAVNIKRAGYHDYYYSGYTSETEDEEEDADKAAPKAKAHLSARERA